MATCAVLLLLPLLLLLSSVTVRCGAVPEQPPADLTDPDTCLAGTLDLLWSVVGRIVRSSVEPAVTRLDDRLSGVQTQLAQQAVGVQTQLAQLAVRLDGVQSDQAAQSKQIAAQNTALEQRLGNIEVALATAQSQHESRLEGVLPKLESRLDEIGSNQESCTLEGVQLASRMEEVQSHLESRLEEVQSQLRSSLEEVQSQLESRLEGVRSRLESRLEEVQSQQRPVRDCSDLPAGATSGVHLLQPGLKQLVPAFCDLDTDGGGWTVFQRRADIPPHRDFFLSWEAYKWGFGELDAEYWWGLEHLFQTTSLLDRRYQLRIDMEDFEGEKRYALYHDFRISSENDGYRLNAANYSGDAGDSLTSHSGMRFSTKDKDQDVHASNCAKSYKGGWWYDACHSSNLNGLYLSGEHSSYADGINWYAFRTHNYSLKTTEMKIRPSKKL